MTEDDWKIFLRRGQRAQEKVDEILRDHAGRENHPEDPNQNPDPYLGGLPISTMQKNRQEGA